MKRRWLILVAGATACAATDAALEPSDAAPDVTVAPTDAAPPPDAAPADAGASCDDCEYFPEVCTTDTVCPDGPFDPATPGGAFDPRTSINAIQGRSESDVWVAGALGALAHFDGTSWRRSDASSRETMLGFWLRDSAEIAIPVPASARQTQHIYARGPSAPDAGELPSPAGWRLSSALLPPGYRVDAEVNSVWGAPGSTRLWFAMTLYSGNTTTSGLVRLRQSSPTAFAFDLGPESSCTPGCNRMNGLHGVSPDALWAVGANGTTIRITAADGTTPRATLYNSRTWDSLNAVWEAGDSEAWAVGTRGTIRHYAGHPFDWDLVSDVPTTVDLNAVWGSSSSDVWAVGDAGVVLHYDGTRWSRVKVAGLGSRRPKLTAVWGPAPGHVWIGGHGVLLSLGGKS